MKLVESPALTVSVIVDTTNFGSELVKPLTPKDALPVFFTLKVAVEVLPRLTLPNAVPFVVIALSEPSVI